MTFSISVISGIVSDCFTDWLDFGVSSQWGVLIDGVELNVNND